MASYYGKRPFQNNGPEVRQQQRMEDALLCAMCGGCWSKMRWCGNKCCELLRTIAVDMDARETAQAELGNELAAAKASAKASVKKVKSECQYFKDGYDEVCRENALLTQVVAQYQQLINAFAPPETAAQIDKAVEPKLEEYNRAHRQSMDRLSTGGASTSHGGDSGGVDERQPRAPIGIRSILEKHQKTAPQPSMLQAIRTNTAKKIQRAEAFKMRQTGPKNFKSYNSSTGEPARKSSRKSNDRVHEKESSSGSEASSSGDEQGDEGAQPTPSQLYRARDVADKGVVAGEQKEMETGD